MSLSEGWRCGAGDGGVPFMRSIPLPDGLDLDHVDARFERGLLTLRLPKSGAQPPPVRRIEVK
ncbi:Hsp20/alpha crystallin family protein [Cupriavidus sp. USMAHM13]|uniref:Hsp20/alpha crystallin family protein n=1 Tax=Cupriavidus sp. USMAHM13 TaxID=1389192 RepID=UPI003001DB1C